MVAHTGFLTHAAAALAPTRRELPRPRRRRRRGGGGLARVPTRASCGACSRGPGSCSASSSPSLFVDDVADALKGSPPRTRLLARSASCSWSPRSARRLGLAIGNLAARPPRRPAPAALRQSDRVAGAVARRRRRARRWCGCSSPRSRARRVGRRSGARLARSARASTASRPTPPDGGGDARPTGRRPDLPRGVRHAHVARRGLAAADGIPPSRGPRHPLACRRGQACDRLQEGTGFVVGRTSSSPTPTWSRGSTAPA